MWAVKRNVVTGGVWTRPVEHVSIAHAMYVRRATSVVLPLRCILLCRVLAAGAHACVFARQVCAALALHFARGMSLKRTEVYRTKPGTETFRTVAVRS